MMASNMIPFHPPSLSLSSTLVRFASFFRIRTQDFSIFLFFPVFNSLYFLFRCCCCCFFFRERGGAKQLWVSVYTCVRVCIRVCTHCVRRVMGPCHLISSDYFYIRSRARSWISIYWAWLQNSTVITCMGRVGGNNLQWMEIVAVCRVGLKRCRFFESFSSCFFQKREKLSFSISEFLKNFLDLREYPVIWTNIFRFIDYIFAFFRIRIFKIE